MVLRAEHREKIAKLKAHAKANVQDSIKMAAAQAADPEAHTKSLQQFVIELDTGLSVIYFHEMQPPLRPFWHLGVVITAIPDVIPDAPTMECVLEAFGMRPLIHSDAVWLEENAPHMRSINVLQAMMPDTTTIN